MAWALVHRVRQRRVRWLLRRGEEERHVRGSLSAWFVQLQAAAFRRVFPVTPDPVRVAPTAVGPFGYVAGWNEKVYCALRARRELGGGKGWWKWRGEVAARAVVEQAQRMRAWRESGSLSGLPLAAVGRKVVVEVERRSRVSVARRERWVQEHAGRREMRDGRWAVARVVEARRTKTGGVLSGVGGVEGYRSG